MSLPITDGEFQPLPKSELSLADRTAILKKTITNFRPPVHRVSDPSFTRPTAHTAKVEAPKYCVACNQGVQFENSDKCARCLKHEAIKEHIDADRQSNLIFAVAAIIFGLIVAFSFYAGAPGN